MSKRTSDLQANQRAPRSGEYRLTAEARTGKGPGTLSSRENRCRQKTVTSTPPRWMKPSTC